MVKVKYHQGVSAIIGALFDEQWELGEAAATEAGEARATQSR